MQCVNLIQASEVIGLYQALAVAYSTCVMLTTSAHRKSHIWRSVLEAEIYLFLSPSSFFIFPPQMICSPFSFFLPSLCHTTWGTCQIPDSVQTWKKALFMARWQLYSGSKADPQQGVRIYVHVWPQVTLTQQLWLAIVRSIVLSLSTELSSAASRRPPLQITASSFF